MTDEASTPATATGDAAARADDPAEGRPDVPPGGSADDRAGRDPGEMVIALSPRQIIGGFALLAGLIIMLRRRRPKG